MDPFSSQFQAQAQLTDPDNYPSRSGNVDEAYTADGQIRSHWQYLLNSLHAMGADAIEEQYNRIHSMLREADSQIHHQPNATQSRQLNPVPLLISNEEWSSIESALVERAELFNLILQDIYGERKLVTQGIIPPELLFSHAGFLRPCNKVSLAGQHQLILHGADVARDLDGSLKVMADFTQAPPGAGYALQNRSLMNRAFANLMCSSHIHCLSPFFTHLQQKLNELNPNGGTARIVVLTPGGYSQTYLEQAYLANYLGLPLVQGSDLSVRDGYVWMKTLEGLKRVDVILRRVSDLYCDPVELRGDSHLGVPGLLEIARMGHVAIANPLGSGVLENPALLRYLPQIAQVLLGRDLQIASVKTWWCGDAADLNYVCANMQTLVIKPIYRKPGVYEVYGAALNANKLQAWQNRIRKNPYQYVAQEFIPGVKAPTWHEGKIQPRASILRTFAVASASSYAVLPGGLARVNLELDKKMTASQCESTAKDTWVLASAAEQSLALRSAGPQAAQDWR